MRLTIGALVKATGLCESTIRKYADGGKIPHQRAESGWRIFDENSVKKAKMLAGIKGEPTPANDVGE